MAGDNESHPTPTGPPGAAASDRQLAAAVEELQRARAEQQRLQLMVKGLSGALREQADAHLETLDRLQHREEEALRRSEERFELLLESAGEGVCGIDDGGRVSFVNPAAARLVGSDPTASIDRPLHAAVRHAHDAETPCTGSECPLEAPLRTGLQSTGEAILLGPDGHTLAVEYTSTPIRDAETVIGAVIVLRDVTERRRIDEHRARLVHDLQASLTARDDFLSIASHELRTPLTPLRFHVHMLKRAVREKAGADAEPLSQRISTVETQLDRLDRLIDQLLDVSRITVGRLELHREPVDLAAVVRDVVARMQSEFARAGSAVSVDAPAPVVGEWDALRIEQVVTNLLSNAVKYGAGRPIQITARLSSGVAMLAVRDHGIGIAPEDQARIFDRFERIVSVRHYSGFGLGLWIVREIVEAHDGAIQVRSQPEEGSTFTVTLPVKPRLEGAAPAASADVTRTGAGPP